MSEDFRKVQPGRDCWRLRLRADVISSLALKDTTGRRRPALVLLREVGALETSTDGGDANLKIEVPPGCRHSCKWRGPCQCWAHRMLGASYRPSCSQK